LVGKNDIAHLVIRSESTHGGKGEDSGDSKGVKGPNIGPIRDPVWWDLVELTVAGEKGNFYVLHLSHHETWRRKAIRGGLPDLLGLGEKPKTIEPRSTDDSDPRGHGKVV
jgi:hypothetical protein